MDFNTDGILLYAKQSGITSFTSLWAIKRALDTTKIGHTGTLDNFADGLLVVLVSRIRKLCAHITDLDKTYEAIIRFGAETDTLDRDGSVIAEAPFPSEQDFRLAVSGFTGPLSQMPPVYSAIQVQGRRSSELVRQGRAPELKPRQVTVHSVDILEFTGEYAHIRVHCSKGTYIRSLARDIAAACGSRAHLAALRRIACGPFTLEQAAGAELLPPFTISWHLEHPPLKISPADIPEPESQAIRESLLPFTARIARSCGFTDLYVKPEHEADVLSGRRLETDFFLPSQVQKNAVCAVFSERAAVADGRFCGILEKKGKRFFYRFILQDESPRPSPLRGARKFSPHPSGKGMAQS